MIDIDTILELKLDLDTEITVTIFKIADYNIFTAVHTQSHVE